ncbi:hypothetical protein Q3P05_12385 [Ralstonia pseudosolanacearum]|nr:hypothetical protein [Ralstonia pseudosolanacearum]
MTPRTIVYRPGIGSQPGHPLERHAGEVWVGGQGPARQQDADDKFATNARLCCHGLPVAACGRRHRAGQRPTRCCRCAG